jgi:general stress protein CsbA
VEEKEIQDELASIRSLMERSSKFISLSGLSGILAGVYALIAAGLAYSIVYSGSSRVYTRLNLHTDPTPLYNLIAIAAFTLLLSIVTGVILTTKKAKRKGQPVWGKISQSLLFHMATPLVTGGIVILIFLFRGYYGIVGPTSLIFYGLSLVGASNFTFTMVKYLGLCEIILGLIAACLPGYGLLFWAIGFGVLHIVYGSLMYLKYDR